MAKKDKKSGKGRKIGKIIGILLAIVVLVVAAMVIVVLNKERPGLHTIEEYREMYPEVVISQEETGDVTVEPAEGYLPVGKGVILYVGAEIAPDAYIPLMAELAERGYECYVPKIMCNMAALEPAAADDVIAAHPETTEWYLAGHSMGGLTASGYVEDNPGKVLGLIFLAAYTNRDLSESDVPVLAIYGDQDTEMNKAKYDSQMSKNPKDFTEVIIEGGNHAQFGDYGEQPHDSPATITAEEQWEKTAGAMDTWMLAH